MTKFRPCIDLHDGQVKQIVGGTLRDSGQGPKENFVSDQSPESFAEMYRSNNLTGGHVIQLGPGNREAARAALSAWPNGMQIGGGINADNAAEWLEAGASHIIITSSLFNGAGEFQEETLRQLAQNIGKENIVVDLSCRVTADGWAVAMNRWQTLTDLEVSTVTLDRLAQYCDEFLIHAADVEGLCGGIDEALVGLLGSWGGIPVTYAGGVATMEDVGKVNDLSGGKVDVTVGSALDIFGGTGVTMDELLAWNRDEV